MQSPDPRFWTGQGEAGLISSPSAVSPGECERTSKSPPLCPPLMEAGSPGSLLHCPERLSPSQACGQARGEAGAFPGTGRLHSPTLQGRKTACGILHDPPASVLREVAVDLLAPGARAAANWRCRFYFCSSPNEVTRPCRLQGSQLASSAAQGLAARTWTGTAEVAACPGRRDLPGPGASRAKTRASQASREAEGLGWVPRNRGSWEPAPWGKLLDDLGLGCSE